MKHKLRSLSLVLALALAFALAVPALAAEGEDVVILYTNDVHTHIDNNVGEGNEGQLTYSKVAAYKASLDNALLVDAGDHIQGTVYGSMDGGETITALMNAAGYDAATLGNHEFDYGMDGLAQVIQWAQFPYLCCNFYHEENGEAGERVLEPYTVVQAGDVKVAFVGVTTPESFTSSTPAYFQDEAGNFIYGIAGGSDGTALYAAVQTAIDAAAREADYVIALGHLGVDPSSVPWTSRDVIAHTTGLTAFLDGHSHTQIAMETVADREGEPVVLTQTGEYLNHLGQLTIAADGTVTARLLSADDLAEVTPDPGVAALEAAWVAQVDGQLGQAVGRVETVLDNYDADGNRLVRRQETNTGDFVTDALYDAFDRMGLEVDAAIMNGGGIRNGAVTGEVTYKTCKEIHPFGNVACLVRVTGRQILYALEFGAKDVAADSSRENGGFLQVSGLKYTIDPTVPSSIPLDEMGFWAGPPTGALRVTDVQILDRDTGEYVPLDLDASYNLAGYNYTLRGQGDGFRMFDGAVNILDGAMEDYMILASYIQSFPDGVVTGYEAPQGRITIQAGSAAAPQQPGDQSPEQTPDPQVYVVAAGDSLWKIAQALYGEGSRWPALYEANRDLIADPDRIYVGQTLVVP